MDSAPRLVPGRGVVGVLGGGQLGRMMALAARAMGLGIVVWDPDASAPAGKVADRLLAVPYTDPAALEAFSELVDVVTYEFENVDYEASLRLTERRAVFPPPALLRVSQHRLLEKDAASRLGLQTTPYQAVNQVDDAVRAAQVLGTPGILKTVRGGYDGKGQARVGSVEAASRAFDELRGDEHPLIYERRVSLKREISVVVARDQHGRVEPFPVVENHHRDGILDWSLVPARIDPALQARATAQACRLAEGFHLVGVMAVEFFVSDQDEVLFNEMAPRPHNSGHWTIEAAWPSQFSQHMRAVAGWEIARPEWLRPTVMINLLGDLFLEGTEPLSRVLALPGVQLHWYDKAVMRPGRKVGHLTVIADTPDEAMQTAMQAKTVLGGRWHDGS